MSRFMLHTVPKERKRLKILAAGMCCLALACGAGYLVHSIGVASAKSRETVLIYTEEEFEEYLLDQESGEYSLKGRYQLEADLDLSWLEKSIGTNIEPFTGKLDGNGHVISGLERPLFGVLENAEVENLFFSGAKLVRPFTYSDGSYYVDGYGALAAYAVDSVIHNCGMSGEIEMASPSEAEYQLAKASASDAYEEGGPGVPGGMEVPAESGAESMEKEKEKGPGIGPGAESETSSGDEIEGTMDETMEETGAKGPGVSGTDLGGAEEEKSSTAASPSPEENTSRPAGDSIGETAGDGSISGGEVDGVGQTESKESEVPSEGETDQETNPSGSATHPSDLVPVPSDSVSAPSDTASVPLDSVSTPSDTASTLSDLVSAPSDTALAPSDSVPAASDTASTSSDSISAPSDPVSETVGCLPLDRQHLMMKVSAVMDSDIEEALTASPSDATPSDAEESTDGDNSNHLSAADDTDAGTETEAESMEFIGNPDGDIYILVTAERVTAGGLVAELAGQTQMSDSFALATIGSGLDEVDTYAGGIVGIIGGEACVENSYATGLLDCSNVAAGFAAVNEGRITNCFSTAAVSDRGAVRGAFTAVEQGTLTGCVYDLQMACVSEGEDLGELRLMSASESVAEAPEFSLKAMNTKEMTGEVQQIPGDWYITSQAYPQIAYFAEHEQEAIATESKVSAIPLILPEGYTLEDVVTEDGIVLPAKIDGQEIQWEKEEDAEMVPVNPVMLQSKLSEPEGNVQAKPSQKEPKQLKPEQLEPGQLEPEQLESEQLEPEQLEPEQLESEQLEPEQLEPRQLESEQSERNQPELDQSAPAQSESNQPTSEEPSGSTTTFSRMKAQINGSSKTFQLRIGARAASATWDSVVTDKGWDENYLRNHTVTLPEGTTAPMLDGGDGSSESTAYVINSPEALAWFSYQVNHSYAAFGSKCAVLGTDIDLTGDLYGGSQAAPLLWTAMGVTDYAYAGSFDGGGHTIDYLTINASTSKQGFFGVVDDGTVKNLTIGRNSNVNSASDIVGAFAGEFAGAMINCMNYGTVTGTQHVAGFVGILNSPSEVRRCGNWGTVSSGRISGGIISYIKPPAGGIEQRVVSACYNAGTIIVTTADRVAGICPANDGDKADPATGNSKIFSNCYNAGEIISPGGKAYQLALLRSHTCPNSFVDSTVMPEDTLGILNGATLLTTEQLQSWAAAYALNGQSMDGPWDYTPGEYPSFGTLDSPENWLVVGQGIMDGLVTEGKLTNGNGSIESPYEIATAEQLACFSWMVNQAAGQSSICGKLTADIHLFGSSYTRYMGEPTLANISNALQWVPMGTSEAPYQGTFDGDGYQINGLYINISSERVGLFGNIQYPAKIRKLGIGADSKVTGSNYCGSFAGVAVNVSEGSSEVTDCYNLGTVRASTGYYAGGIMGDDIGTGLTRSVIISNCYNAGDADNFALVNRGQINDCYADITRNPNNGRNEKSSGNGVTRLTTAQMKSNTPVTGLNTIGGVQKTGTDRTWYTSLDDEKTRGYPGFTAPTTVAATFAPDTPEAGEQVSLPAGIPAADMRLRSIEAVDSTFTPGSTAAAGGDFTLASYSDLTGADSGYHNFGTINANQKLAFKAGGTDLFGLTASLNQPTANLGTVSSLSLGRAAACTKPEDRYILLEGSSGLNRFEIQITVKGIVSKTLSMTMPIEVTMAQLTPDGTDRRDYSIPLNIQNKNAYPVDVSIVSVTPRTGTGYLTLNPVAQSITLPNNQEITGESGGVKLGVANQSGNSGPLAKEVYYNPGAASGTAWLEYRVKHGGTFPYRYFIEYSGLHFPRGEEQFGYDINYGFRVAEQDYTDTAVSP